MHVRAYGGLCLPISVLLLIFFHSAHVWLVDLGGILVEVSILLCIWI